MKPNISLLYKQSRVAERFYVTCSLISRSHSHNFVLMKFYAGRYFIFAVYSSSIVGNHFIVEI